LPVHAGVRHGGPIDTDVIFIIESEELFPGELRVVVRDNGVWDSKMMDDVKEEQHGLLGLDHGDWSNLYPLCKLVYGNKQVRIAPRRSLKRPDHIKPPDHERPCDGDHFGVLGPIGGHAKHSIDTLHSCAQSVQRRLLRSASRSPVRTHF